MAEPPKAIHDLGGQGVALRLMPLVHHDVLLGIASAGDMIDGTGEMTLPAASYGESQVETG